MGQCEGSTGLLRKKRGEVGEVSNGLNTYEVLFGSNFDLQIHGGLRLGCNRLRYFKFYLFLVQTMIFKFKGSEVRLK
jgi:hypothetical protein